MNKKTKLRKNSKQTSFNILQFETAMKHSIVFLALVLYLTGHSDQACSDEFKKAFLNRHNELRAKHGVPALEYDESINAWAQEWADELLKKGKIEHRPNNKYVF